LTPRPIHALEDHIFSSPRVRTEYIVTYPQYVTAVSSTHSQIVSVVGSYEHGNEFSGSLRELRLLDQQTVSLVIICSVESISQSVI
jgi:hypothetical protein